MELFQTPEHLSTGEFPLAIYDSAGTRIREQAVLYSVDNEGRLVVELFLPAQSISDNGAGILGVFESLANPSETTIAEILKSDYPMYRLAGYDPKDRHQLSLDLGRRMNCLRIRAAFSGGSSLLQGNGIDLEDIQPLNDVKIDLVPVRVVANVSLDGTYGINADGELGKAIAENQRLTMQRLSYLLSEQVFDRAHNVRQINQPLEQLALKYTLANYLLTLALQQHGTPLVYQINVNAIRLDDSDTNSSLPWLVSRKFFGLNSYSAFTNFWRNPTAALNLTQEYLRQNGLALIEEHNLQHILAAIRLREIKSKIKGQQYYQEELATEIIALLNNGYHDQILYQALKYLQSDFRDNPERNIPAETLMELALSFLHKVALTQDFNYFETCFLNQIAIRLNKFGKGEEFQQRIILQFLDGQPIREVIKEGKQRYWTPPYTLFGKSFRTRRLKGLVYLASSVASGMRQAVDLDSLGSGIEPWNEDKAVDLITCSSLFLLQDFVRLRQECFAWLASDSRARAQTANLLRKIDILKFSSWKKIVSTMRTKPDLIEAKSVLFIFDKQSEFKSEVSISSTASDSEVNEARQQLVRQMEMQIFHTAFNLSPIYWENEG